MREIEDWSHQVVALCPHAPDPGEWRQRRNPTLVAALRKPQGRPSRTLWSLSHAVDLGSAIDASSV